MLSCTLLLSYCITVVTIRYRTQVVAVVCIIVATIRHRHTVIEKQPTCITVHVVVVKHPTVVTSHDLLLQYTHRLLEQFVADTCCKVTI